jgi:hypothetical protein
MEKAMTIKKPKEIKTKNSQDKRVRVISLPQDFFQYKTKLIKKLDSFDPAIYEGSLSQFIVNLIETLPYFAERRDKCREMDYKDFAKGYEYYLKVAMLINEKTKYIPTLPDYCKFVGLTVKKFNLKMQFKNELGDVFDMINNDLQGRTIQSIMLDDINNISGIFVAKATLGMRDTEQQVTNINILNTTRSIDDIMSDLEKYKANKIEN